ncbi:MAG TPA: hypothetical protein VGM88_30765 [Kofleriaceae bacterium]
MGVKDAGATTAGGAPAGAVGKHSLVGDATPEQPPAHGSFRFATLADGGYQLILNSADIKGDPAKFAFRVYVRLVFPGITPAQIDEVAAAGPIALFKADPVPEGEHEYRVNVHAALQQSLVGVVARVAPGVAFVAPSAGGAAGKQVGAKPKQPSDIVAADRAIYDRLVKAFPEAPELHGSQALVELFSYLSEHPEAANAKLDVILAGFREHAKSRFGDAQRDGWAIWKPAGQIELKPDLQRYVNGATVSAEVEWDTSMSPNAGEVYIANHTRYAWNLTQYGKVVDSSAKAYLHDNRQVYLDFDGQPGRYEIEMTATSKHFDTPDHEVTIKRPVATFAEEKLDKQTFDKTFVEGDDAAFERLDGELFRRPDQHAQTAADEDTTNAITRGQVDELGRSGQISEGSQEVLDAQLDKEHEELKKIEEKTKNGTPYFIRGTFVDREDSSSQTMRVLMSMTRRAVTPEYAVVNVLMHDLTLGSATQHPGDGKIAHNGKAHQGLVRAEMDALAEVAADFHAHNDYDKGTVHLAAERLTQDLVWEKTIDTNNGRKQGQKLLHGVEMVGTAALMLLPGGQPLAIGIMIATTAASAASLAIELQDQISKEGTLKIDRRLAMDLLTVVTLALPFAEMSKVLKEASAIAKTRFVAGKLVLDGIQGFVMTADTRDQLMKVDANYDRAKALAADDPEKLAALMDQRDRAVAGIIGSAVMSGGFVLVSAAGNLSHFQNLDGLRVRDPIAKLAAGPRADMERVVTEGYFHDGTEVVELAPDERRLLEQKLAAPEKPKPKVKAPEQAPGVEEPATAVVFAAGADVEAAVKRVPPEGDYFDVAVHSDGDNFWVLHDGEWVPLKANSVRKWIRKQPGYKGQPIRLLACEAGAIGATAAQAIADGMRVFVKAPTAELWIKRNGSLVVGPSPTEPTGGWREFGPNQAPRDIAAPPEHVEPGAKEVPGDPHADAVKLAKPLSEKLKTQGRAGSRARLKLRAQEVANAPNSPIADQAVDALEGEAQVLAEEGYNRVGDKATEEQRLLGAKANVEQQIDGSAIAEARVLAREAADRISGTDAAFLDLPADVVARKTAFNADDPSVGKAAREWAPKLPGMTAAQMKVALEPEVAAGRAVFTTPPFKDPRPNRGMQEQLLWTFKDGTEIRVKPFGDDRHVGLQMYSIEVNRQGTSGPQPQDGIAFKVDTQGRAVPKGPDDVRNPYKRGEYPAQYDAFAERVMEAGHRRVKQ